MHHMVHLEFSPAQNIYILPLGDSNAAARIGGPAHSVAFIMILHGQCKLPPWFHKHTMLQIGNQADNPSRH